MASVIAFNGSPHGEGNTSRLLRYVLDECERAGIETGLVQVGGERVNPCTVCGRCIERHDGQCAQSDDLVNESIARMIDADAIVIGTPTYFAGVTPEIKAFMDRAFFVAKMNGDLFRRKLGAGVAVDRRSGAVCAVDTINHYFTISGMFSAGSSYWNNAKGFMPGDVESDEEGLATMRHLGENIAWFVRTTERGRLLFSGTHDRSALFPRSSSGRGRRRASPRPSARGPQSTQEPEDRENADYEPDEAEERAAAHHEEEHDRAHAPVPAHHAVRPPSGPVAVEPPVQHLRRPGVLVHQLEETVLLGRRDGAVHPALHQLLHLVVRRVVEGALLGAPHHTRSHQRTVPGLRVVRQDRGHARAEEEQDKEDTRPHHGGESRRIGDILSPRCDPM
jgi:multimeric flavodoxin WrbA